MQGTRIWDYTHGIPNACEPTPIINAYIELNLQTLESAGLLEPIKAAQGHGYGACARPPGVDVTFTVQSQLNSEALTDAQSSKHQMDIVVQQVTLLLIWKCVAFTFCERLMWCRRGLCCCG